jgi:phage tail-like protein
MARQKDPTANYNFEVRKLGLKIASFREVTGLESSIEVIDYREGGDKFRPNRKLPGKVTYVPIVLKVGVTDDPEMWDWHQKWVKGEPAERVDFQIVLLDRAGTTDVRTWNVYQAWPAKWVGPAFNAEAHEVAIQTLELAHEGIDLA